MKILENLSVLLVIPDLSSKTKLREVLRAILYKGEVQYERTLKEFEKKISEPIFPKYHVAFISGKYPSTEITSFLKTLSQVSDENKPAIIIALPSAYAKTSGEIATWYIEGVSGFISEPYTSQDLSDLLVKILEQKAKNPNIEDGTKSRKASNFLMTDAMGLLDEVARLASEGKEGGYPLRDLKSLSKTFAEYYAQDPQGYETAIVETFQKAKPPTWAKGTARNKAKAKVIKHPGALIWELMAQRAISEERLVSLLRIEPSAVAALTRGQLSVDETLAQGLSRIFGMSPREWLKMQTEFDAHKASQTNQTKT